MSIELKRDRLPPRLYASKYHPEEGETAVQIPDGVTDLKPFLFLKKEISAVSLPDSVERIGMSAFSQCGNLTQITLPPYLREIAISAFEKSALTQIVIPDSVKKLETAFQYCTSLETVVLPKKLKELNPHMFYGCTKLKNVTFPEALETIGYSAFRQTGLESVVLPSALRRIDEFAFERCPNLRQAVLPDGLQFIWKEAFRCTALQSIRIPESVTKIGFHAFDKGVMMDICVQDAVVSLTLEQDWGFDEQDMLALLRNPNGTDNVPDFDALKSENCRDAAVLWLLYHVPDPTACRNYLLKNLSRIIKKYILSQNTANISLLFRTGLLGQEMTDECIAFTIEHGLTEITAMLVNYKNEKFGISETTFRL